MLRNPFAAVSALLLLVGSPAVAADLPAKLLGTVTMEKVEIRAQAAWQAPQTMFLKRGEQVAIHHEDGQFYAILPPPGSISYVKHLFLGEFDPKAEGRRNAVIKQDNYAVHVGSEIEVSSDGMSPSFVTNIRPVKLPYGAIVEIVGPKYAANDTFWYPIAPPEGEYRYIPKSAVGNLQPVTAPSSGTRPGPSGVVVGNPESVPTNPSVVAVATKLPDGAKVAHPLWGEAELLQSQGRYTEAGKVYVQIYQELKEKRADLEDLLTCLNRIDECKEKGKSPGLNIGSTRESPRDTTANLERPTAMRPAPQPAPPPARKDWPTSRNEERVETRSPSTSATDGDLKSSGPGVLRRAPFFIDNKQAFALQTNNGELLYYVTAGQGVSLDSFISKRVELQGAVVVRGELRGAPYMVVTKASAAK